MEGKEGGEGEGEGIDRKKKKIFQLFKTNRLTGLLYMCVFIANKNGNFGWVEEEERKERKEIREGKKGRRTLSNNINSSKLLPLSCFYLFPVWDLIKSRFI
ncbi:unnamed protein product [Meloidogyne enterolobii]|uniref:Uncharacterized protein n=1 Tax=Meloidogyne enterolobii TaxID=390850 RepID=A0ACB0XZ48_MELEN